jgi:hypothetical protein
MATALLKLCRENDATEDEAIQMEAGVTDEYLLREDTLEYDSGRSTAPPAVDWR